MTAARPRRRQRVPLVERLKREAPPLGLLDELERLAATPYESVDEGDILRLQWLGLYHDKPKVGSFMLRVRLPGGAVTADELAAIARVSRDFGRGTGELTTRQGIQLHEVELPTLPAVLAALDAAGLSTRGACGDVLRNVTACPLAGRHPGETFDVRPVVAALEARFAARPGSPYADLPRKHKWTVVACPDQCTAPEIHDVGLIATHRDGAPGFALRVGGGLSTVPRLARDLGVFVGVDVVGDVLGALLDVWRTDDRYRRSRGRSRFKFLVDDLGADGVREAIEARVGPLPDGRAPEPVTATLRGVVAQPDGRRALAVPVPQGLLGAEAMDGVARLARRLGAGIRLTRQQNLLLVDVDGADVDDATAELADLGLPLDAHPLVADSIACTGNPYCNFAIGRTKPKLRELVDHLIARGDVPELTVHLDGCPHACGQHWVGDLGFQGTTTRRDGVRVEAYDIYLRGRRGPAAAIGEAVLRKVPDAELEAHVDRLLDRWLGERTDDRPLSAWAADKTTDELKRLMLEEAR